MFKYVFFFILFAFSLLANPSHVLVNDRAYMYDKFTISYYKDASSAMSIKEISEMPFEKESFNKFSFGYFEGSVWLKMEFTNESQKSDFILSTSEHFYEEANLYYFEQGWKKIENGVFMPLSKRGIQTSKLAFELHLASNTSKTVYLELRGKYAYFGNLTLYQKDYFFQNQFLGIESFFLFLFGIVIIIILFNLFLYIKLREIIYFYYVGYTFFSLIYLINISGLLSYFDMQHYLYSLHVTAGLSIVFLSLFSLEYLNIQKHLKYGAYFIKTVLFLLLLFSFLLLFFYTPWNKIINNTVTILNISLIISALIVYIKGEHYVKYYLFAMMLFLISIITYVLMLSGAIEYSTLTRYGYIFSMSIEIVLFSLMLAERYNVIKNEQIKTKSQLIELQNNQNKKLEEEVIKQTQNIQNANNKLSTLVQERELLVKEVFHRVKNNFHMINAFLWFESKKEKNANRFTELINRIKSMSLIHDYVCNSKDLVHINAKEYLGELIKTIIRTYHDRDVSVNTKIEAITIDYDYIISIGIILNEIISNSVKHNSTTSAIILDIACYKEDEIIVLRVKDNGEGFDVKTQQAGFGRELIKDFCQKLPQGEFSFHRDAGTLFELKFKDIKNDEI